MDINICKLWSADRTIRKVFVTIASVETIIAEGMFNSNSS